MFYVGVVSLALLNLVGSSTFVGLTVRLSVEPEETCLDAEIRARVEERHKILGLNTLDASMLCKRKRERCSTWYCSASEKEVSRRQRHFKADGLTLARPLPCASAPDGAIVDGYWGLCAALAPYRPPGWQCRYLVVLREPLGRLQAEYSRYCASADGGGGEAAAGLSFLDFAKLWNNHYTRIFAGSFKNGWPERGAATPTHLRHHHLPSQQPNSTAVAALPADPALLQRALRRLRSAEFLVVVVDHGRKMIRSGGGKGVSSGPLSSSTSSSPLSVWEQLTRALDARDDDAILSARNPSSTSQGSAAGAAAHEGGAWCGLTASGSSIGSGRPETAEIA
eukprot:CAMPEP_0171786138 /NCGR_PEP_ID=MMETSP0991-20121206/63104_1 /TAXON_ID=483369 /ORGANISM="non described non described, Strain CCMP2098" /LENGTH=336 /DNA_ID=CAMNT_0012394797 /DNA_START=37 /DNA_END=1044 /DNA_ORIENTATION=-